MKNLPLNLQADINGFLFHAIPYSILNTFSKYKDYLMEHYMQCFGYIDNTNCLIYDYIDGMAYHSDIAEPLDIVLHSYKAGLQLDIKEYILSSICNDCYAVIFVDEYYIENRPAYQQQHRLHEILIYGYDDDKFNYMAFGRRLYYASFSQNQIEDAYKSGYSLYIEMPINEKVDWIDGKSVILIKRKQIHDQYIFSGRRFVQNLRTYLHGEANASYNSFMISEKKRYNGVYNTNLIKYCVDNPSENIFTIYPAIHTWYESKRNLLTKIRHCYERVNCKHNKLISDYKNSVEIQSEKIRLAFLKYQESGKLNRDMISVILNNIFDSETNIINEIYDELIKNT